MIGSSNKIKTPADGYKFLASRTIDVALSDLQSKSSALRDSAIEFFESGFYVNFASLAGLSERLIFADYLKHVGDRPGFLF